MTTRFYSICLIFLLASSMFGQIPVKNRFVTVAGEKTLKQTIRTLDEVCPLTDFVNGRILRDYGAVYVSEPAVRIAYRCMLESDADIEAFQAAANRVTGAIGGVQVTLQKPAMDALLAATRAATKQGLSITPRGGTMASTRSYSDTVRLWNSRLKPGLRHWTARGEITRADADKVLRLPVSDQVHVVLSWETEHRLWFSKDLSKSILYSVAAPGASQHNFMVALDVAEFANVRVRKILEQHGWYQTVKSDMPHFTYLGVQDLKAQGLRPEVSGGQTFWVPDI